MEKQAAWALAAVFGMKALVAIVVVALAAGCDAFVGPSTQEFDCPVRCAKGVCCPSGWECSRWPDRPCRAAPSFWDRVGDSRDAGRD